VVCQISQKHLLRSRDRVLTGLVGGLASYLDLSPGLARLAFLAIFMLSILVNVWLLVLILYMLLSAVIPREDDPEDLKARGFVIDIGRLVTSLISLIFLGVGVAVIVYSAAAALLSLGLYTAGIMAPPFAVTGILGFTLSILGILVGLVITWVGSAIAKRV